VKVKAVADKFVPKWSVYQSGTPLTRTEVIHAPKWSFGEKPVPKWYVPKWSCTELALTRQWSSHSPCVTWSRGPSWRTSRAAAFCARCSGAIVDVNCFYL